MSIANGRDADLREVFRRQMTEDVLVDRVVAKSHLILPETQTAKPPADIHRRAPHGFTGYSLKNSQQRLRQPQETPCWTPLWMSSRGGSKCFDRLGESVDGVLAEVAQPEAVA